jgi:hypothetical protein
MEKNLAPFHEMGRMPNGGFVLKGWQTCISILHFGWGEAVESAAQRRDDTRTTTPASL